MSEGLTIGEVSRRSGVATSALRFYESRGLIDSERTEGNQRRYRRSVLRRVAVIKAAQSVGLTLGEVKAQLSVLPVTKAPSSADWERLSSAWRSDLDAKIEELEHLRDDLTSCIGCGCLSLDSCSLLNPQDAAAELGSGPRYLIGDDPVGGPPDSAR